MTLADSPEHQTQPETGGQPKPRAWDRLEGETDKAHAAFLVHLHTPRARRSLRRTTATYYAHRAFDAAIEKGEPLAADDPLLAAPAQYVDRHIKRWSREHSWGDRVRAWDAEVERKLQEAFLDERAAVAREHARIGAELQEQGMALLEYFTSGTGRADATHAAAVRMVVDGMKVERTARGMTDQIIELRPDAEGDAGGSSAKLPPPDWYVRFLAIVQQLGLDRAPPEPDAGATKPAADQ